MVFKTFKIVKSKIKGYFPAANLPREINYTLQDFFFLVTYY